jgi:hypothetical protein
MNRRLLTIASAFALAFFSAGCGKNEIGDSNNGDVARLRFLNASPDTTSVDFLVDSLQVLTDVNYTESSGYFEVDEGNRRLQAITPGNITAFDISPRIEDGEDYTVIATNFLNNIQPLFLLDDNDQPDIGDFKFRFVDAAPSGGNFDVYVTRQNTDIFDSSPILTNVQFQDVSSYFSFTARELQIRLTRAGTKDIIVDTGAIRFDDQDIRTAIVIDSPGGGAPYRVLLLADRN